MIKFFRKIRQKLLSENKFSSYLIYSIGEIVLVVIGILIALSINNWNNERQNDIREMDYLEGLKNDLTHDTEFIKEIIPVYDKHIQDFNRIDSLVRIKSDSIFQFEFQEIYSFSRMIPTFYPRIGSYASLVSENSTALISSDSLSKRLRDIYDIQYFRVGNLGQQLDELANQISWERRLDFRHKFMGYDHQDFDALFADLNEMNDGAYWYARRLKRLLGRIEECIGAIDKELEK